MPSERAAIYVRVSTRSQVEEGSSLETQEADLREEVSRRGWELVEVFRDPGQSGRRARRPGLDSALELAREGGFDHFLVWKTSRFARSVRDFLNLVHELGEVGVTVHVLRDGYTSSNKLVMSVMAALAEMEADNISEQVRRGKTEASRQGKWNGGSAPYGTRAVPAPEGHGSVLEVDPTEQQTIEELYAWITEERLSVYAAAQRLNAMGIKTRRGRRWSRANLGHLLASNHLHRHGVLSEERWTTIQEARSKNSRAFRPKSNNLPYPLSGRISCSCGGRYIGSRGGDGRRRYYRCNRNDSQTAPERRCTAGSRHWITATGVEAAVWQVIREVLTDPDKLRQAAEEELERRRPADLGRIEDNVARYSADVRDLEAALARLVGDYARRGVDGSALEKAQAEIETDLATARELLRDAQARMTTATEDRERWSTIEAAASSIEWFLDREDSAADPHLQVRVYEDFDIQVELLEDSGFSVGGRLFPPMLASKPAQDEQLVSQGSASGRKSMNWEDLAQVAQSSIGVKDLSERG